MAGFWTEERRAKAREIAMLVKPWLKSTGPRTPEGKAVVAKNAYRGGIRQQRRSARRDCKGSIRALELMLAWEEMEARIDAWLRAMRAAGQAPTAKALKRAGLKELPLPRSGLPADDLALIFAPLASEVGPPKS